MKTENFDSEINIRDDEKQGALQEREEDLLQSLMDGLKEYVNCSDISTDLRQNLRALTEAQGDELMDFFFSSYVEEEAYEEREDFEEFDFKEEAFLEIFLKDMLNPDLLKEILYSLTPQSFLLFQEALEKPREIVYQDFRGLQLLIQGGLLFFTEKEGRYFVFVCDEIKEKVKDFDFQEIQAKQKENEAIYQTTVAAVELYGAISYEDLLALMKKYHAKVDFSKEELKTLLERYHESIVNLSFIQDDFVSHGLFYDGVEDFVALLEGQRGKPRYIPDKLEDFLKYQDNEKIHPSLEEKRVEAFFREIDDHEIRLENHMGFLHFHFQMDFAMEDALRTIVYENYSPSSKKKQSEMLDLLIAMEFNTKKWVNNGYSNFELHTFYPEEFPMKNYPGEKSVQQRTEPSKNGPCPCGSGKKYKRCCGK